MKFQTYDTDRPGEMKTLFETERATLYIPIPGREGGHYLIKMTEEGNLEIGTNCGGALHIIPHASNLITVRPGKFA